MRMVRRLLVLLVFASGLAPAITHARRHPMTRRQKARRYRRRTFGKGAVARSAARAGVNQLRRSPRQWGGGPIGYAKRFGSAFGQQAIGSTIGFGVGTLRHEDPHYYRSGRKGTWPRLKYAMKHTFVARKDNGKKTVAAGKLSGAMGGAMVARTWAPGGFALGTGLASGGASVGGLMAANVAREFWPRHKRRHARGTRARRHQVRAGRLRRGRRARTGHRHKARTAA